MGANVDALKALYVALGGESDTVADLTQIAEVIIAIATLVSASGGSLPAVTATDNGKILKVVDGAWAAASAGT